MSQTSPINDSNDALDGLLSSFFKVQMKKPWPAAPATPPMSMPASIANAATTGSPRNQPAAQRDPGSKSRFTLVASVAILLGTCWYLSNDFQPGSRPGSSGPSIPMNKISAGDPDVLKELHKDKAISGEKGITPPVIDLP
jgi:hypothetical protein